MNQWKKQAKESPILHALLEFHIEYKPPNYMGWTNNICCTFQNVVLYKNFSK